MDCELPKLPSHYTENSLSKIEEEMKLRGFTRVGYENLTKFKFSEEAKFEVVQNTTKEEITQEYIDNYKKKGIDIEVELVDKTDLPEQQQAVYVFVKKKN